MKLTELLASQIASGVVKHLRGSLNVDLCELCVDSRRVKTKSLFVAMKGTSQDSHLYLDKAIQAGAVALLIEDVTHLPVEYQGTVFVTPSTRKILSELSDLWNDSPSKKLFCVGVTGTNGKTTTSYMVEWLFKERSPCGVIGTINHHLGHRIWPTELTTPGPVELQTRIREFVEAGADSLSIEISSHALSQGRADHIALDVAIFTNLTRDHLDYHKDFEDYYSAKARMFTQLLRNSDKKKKTAVINTDDPYGKKLSLEVEKLKVPLITYGENEAHLQFRVLKESFAGTEFECTFEKQTQKIFLPQPCRHNVYNAVASVAAGIGYGFSLTQACDRISHFPGVHGRLEPVKNSRGLHIFIDYAHTDDALRSVLNSLVVLKMLNQNKNRILTVFGCGGDRDKGKRPLMAQVAAKYSDQLIVTSDNPRTENPELIIDDIMTGIKEFEKSKVTRLADRKLAIQKSLELAQNGDVILIAGKGHEDYQIIGKERIHFSDREVVEFYL